MKLLFCTRCKEIFSLTYQFKTCTCGLIRGKYYVDGERIVYNGKGLVLGIGNQSLSNLKEKKEERIEIFIHPDTTGNIIVDRSLLGG